MERSTTKFSPTSKILILIFFLSFLFRWFYIKDNHFQFHYEQIRDAITSRQIIENQDLKIQGPSAGNTNETIYHGVLYYYVIGPLYTFSQGSPLLVILVLALLNSSSILPIFLITKDITGSKKIGVVATLLYAFSIDAAQMGIHLQNTSLATVTIPWLFFLIWKVFFLVKNKYVFWLALMFGLTQQTGIYFGYFIIPILISYIYRAIAQKQVKLFSAEEIIKALSIYLVIVSSIIITQMKLYKNGIFKLENLFSAVESQQSGLKSFYEALSLFFEKISNSYLTTNKSLTLIFISFFIIYLVKQKKIGKSETFFLLLWLTSPLLLFTIIPRRTYYMMVGITPAILILYSIFLTKISKKKTGIIISSALVVLFIITNIQVAITQRRTAHNPLYNSPQLRHELALVNKTYEIAQGKEFSISALTSPYGYSTTWAYLYDWYGTKSFGTKPLWFGPTQEGIIGGDLLDQSENTLPLHFTIYEPNTVDTKLLNEFVDLQNIYSGSSPDYFNFGDLKLETRIKKITK